MSAATVRDGDDTTLSVRLCECAEEIAGYFLLGRKFQDLVVGVPRGLPRRMSVFFPRAQRELEPAEPAAIGGEGVRNGLDPGCGRAGVARLKIAQDDGYSPRRCNR
jgi:hypothetical protein